MRALHAAWGIPEAVTRETCQEPNAFCYNHTQMHGGRIGIARSTLFWLRNYTREPYFRLGRLEFWLKPFGEEIRAFRRRDNGEVIALAPEGERFDAQGLHAGGKRSGSRRGLGIYIRGNIWVGGGQSNLCPQAGRQTPFCA